MLRTAGIDVNLRQVLPAHLIRLFSDDMLTRVADCQMAGGETESQPALKISNN